MILQIVVTLFLAVEGRVLDFEDDLGAVADDFSEEVAWLNGGILNSSLPTLEPGDTFFVPNKTFYVMGGINASDISSVVFLIDGTLLFSNDLSSWRVMINDTSGRERGLVENVPHLQCGCLCLAQCISSN